MTITEAIARVNALIPNKYTNEDKVRWLNEIDGVINTEIFDRYEKDETLPTYEPYTAADLTKTLLAPEPYSVLYVYYLQSKINYADNETDRYNNSSAMFNECYKNFGNWYNRTHKAFQPKVKYW